MSTLLLLFEHQRIFVRGLRTLGVRLERKRRALRANMLLLVTFAAETNFPFVGKLLVLTDMGSAVRSFHGNCESQPVKQSR